MTAIPHDIADGCLLSVCSVLQVQTLTMLYCDESDIQVAPPAAVRPSGAWPSGDL